MATTIDVSEAIDQRPLSGFQVRIIVLCVLVAIIDGFDAQAIAFVAPLVAKDFNIPISSFGPIFGAGTLGLTLGALALPPLADRFGRKALTVLACIIFGILSLATVWAETYGQLALIRFFTGVGVGAATPNVVALALEYAPKRMRALLVTVVTGGFPLGAVLGGTISAQMIPVLGWHSVFYLGGVTPLILAVILIAQLPESIRFLVNRGTRPAVVADYLGRIAKDLNPPTDALFVVPEVKLCGFPVRHLLADGRASMTLLLWTAFFLNLLLLFFMYNWLPPMMQQAGLPIQRAIIATVVFNLGGFVGGIVLGLLMDRGNPHVVLAGAYVLGAICIASLGFLNFSIPLLMTAIALGGFCAVGGQTAANALAANSYPTAIRATGVGWALGIGRIGSILGPVIGGLALSFQLGPRDIFLCAAVPALGAAWAILALGRRERSTAAAPVALGAG
jgi:MFS transporter, AAHS family, 4-hydroxybenzoate transporter